MHLKSLIIIFLLLFQFVFPALAGDFEDIMGENSTQSNSTITLSPSGTENDQDYINDAIEKYDTVYLNTGIYSVTGPIYIPKNRNLLGDSKAIIKVSSKISSPWFNPKTGVINCFDPVNIKISGFEVDGNCQNLNNEWANSRPDTAHDCQQLIKVIGSSGEYGKNVEISNMKLHNSFGDGIQARCIDGIICKDTTIINTQHESIYYSACKNCKMVNNKMAVITSDGGRFDNCINGEAEKNLVWQYNGTNNNGAWKGGANGFQVGDAGSSHGYDARKKNIHTTNVEIHNNTIVDPGRKAIVVDAAGQKPSTNLYIHDNVIVGTEELEIMGIPVDDDISSENPPTIEQSEEVFNTIYSILGIENTKFVESGITNQTADEIKYKVIETEKGKVAGGVKIVGWGNKIRYKGIEYVSSPEDALIKFSVVKNPSLDMWSGGIADTQKSFNTTVKNGIATVKMTVTTFWYNLRTNQLTGKHEKSKLKTSVYTFNDSCEAPKIWPEFSNTTGYADEYRGKIKNYTLVSGPSTGLQKIVFRYNGTVTTHYFMIGQRGTGPDGIEYTAFEDVNYWDGDLDHLGASLYINGTFDPDKLQVDCFTPYKNKTLEIKHSIYEQKDDSIEDGLFETIIKALILLFGINKLIKIAKN